MRFREPHRRDRTRSPIPLTIREPTVVNHGFRGPCDPGNPCADPPKGRAGQAESGLEGVGSSTSPLIITPGMIESL
jgi:hypothetical protein